MPGQDNKALAEEYCYGREFVDLLEDAPGVIREPQQLFQVLARLAPRMYSIASSQALHPNDVQTTVRVVRYDAHGAKPAGAGQRASGRTCAGGRDDADLSPCERAVPAAGGPESAPVIMVGPGTGVAPFRAFLEERQATGAQGDNWLFFGEQRRTLDFLYKDQLEGMHQDGVLTRLDTAFSRDQATQGVCAGPDAGALRRVIRVAGARARTFMFVATRRGWPRTWRRRCWTRLRGAQRERWNMRRSTWAEMKKQKAVSAGRLLGLYRRFHAVWRAKECERKRRFFEFVTHEEL